MISLPTTGARSSTRRAASQYCTSLNFSLLLESLTPDWDVWNAVQRRHQAFALKIKFMLNVWFSTGKQRNLRSTSSISLPVIKHSGYRIVLLATLVELCWNSKLPAVFWMDLYVISCLSVYPAGFSKSSRPPSKTISARHFFCGQKLQTG